MAGAGAAAEATRFTLSEAAELFSAHLWDVPQQIRKAQYDAKAAQQTREQVSTGPS